VDWVHLAQDRKQWLSVLDIAMNIQIPVQGLGSLELVVVSYKTNIISIMTQMQLLFNGPIKWEKEIE
jgi:hypothetical protein